MTTQYQNINQRLPIETYTFWEMISTDGLIISARNPIGKANPNILPVKDGGLPCDKDSRKQALR